MCKRMLLDRIHNFCKKVDSKYKLSSSILKVDQLTWKIHNILQRCCFLLEMDFRRENQSQSDDVLSIKFKATESYPLLLLL